MAELSQMIEKFSNMPIEELEDIVNNKSGIINYFFLKLKE